jgi:organic radical activating enzyme
MTLSQKDFSKHMETHFSWGLFFKLTNLCNNFCKHCCERSGPNCEPKFIETSDIKYFLEQLKLIKNHNNFITLTGGEPMMAYTAKSDYYIPQILKYCGKNGYDVHINTNARWALSDKSEQIYSDFDEFVKNYKRKLAFHLSLDKFHEQCVDANAKFIDWIVKSKTITDVYMFFDEPDIVIKMVYKLKRDFNIDISEPLRNNSSYSIHKFSGTNKMLCIMPYQGITNMGRAKDNNIGTKEPFSKTTLYFSPFMDTENEICFDSNGYAILSSQDDDTIKTPFHDKKGKLKQLAIIKQELFNIAYQRLMAENQ